jgi:hypothetical protein
LGAPSRSTRRLSATDGPSRRRLHRDCPRAGRGATRGWRRSRPGPDPALPRPAASKLGGRGAATSARGAASEPPSIRSASAIVVTDSPRTAGANHRAAAAATAAGLLSRTARPDPFLGQCSLPLLLPMNIRLLRRGRLVRARLSGRRCFFYLALSVADGVLLRGEPQIQAPTLILRWRPGRPVLFCCCSRSCWPPSSLGGGVHDGFRGSRHFKPGRWPPLLRPRLVRDALCAAAAAPVLSFFDGRTGRPWTTPTGASGLALGRRRTTGRRRSRGETTVVAGSSRAPPRPARPRGRVARCGPKAQPASRGPTARADRPNGSPSAVAAAPAKGGRTARRRRTRSRCFPASRIATLGTLTPPQRPIRAPAVPTGAVSGLEPCPWHGDYKQRGAPLRAKQS